MAQSRKGYYRAGHYVRPSSGSRRAKMPALWVLVVGALLVIATWNTLFGGEDSKATPGPQRTAHHEKADPDR
ncbi:hypothetical protein ACIQU1_02890 [Streptomyces angustmyceticus]|uniref:hypothetical protein n=1 Tax=Streptomyces angustmyceticus TaxID=285578 RepID=UPI0034500908